MSKMETEAPIHQPVSVSTASLLIVDDNSMNRIMLSRYTTRLGYQSTLVENGRQLAQVFQEMALQVYAREQRLQQQVQQLRIEIDQERRAREVADITDSEYFQHLLGKADELRSRVKTEE
jgi:DNA-binding NtrC family response regulator